MSIAPPCHALRAIRFGASLEVVDAPQWRAAVAAQGACNRGVQILSRLFGHDFAPMDVDARRG